MEPSAHRWVDWSYLPHMALERTNPMHLRRRTRGSLELTGIGKHGPLASHVSLQCRPSLKRACATAVGTKSMSWSMNWPHCISMWLYESSGVTRDVVRTRTDTVRALGRRTPLYSRRTSQPAAFTRPHEPAITAYGQIPLRYPAH